VSILRLHYERIKRRWTQSELGRRAGIQQTTVSAIERGRINPTADELLRLANALLITPPSVLMNETVLPDEAAAEALIGTREAAVR
jgi:transcriptional regulator with XRE-family HTH domain